MREQIDAWYASAPSGDNLGPLEKGMVEKLEATYQTAIFQLYRPSENIPSPSEPQLLVMTQAATRMIKLYRKLFQEHKLSIYWQSVENVFSAGTCLMFAYVQSTSIRASMTLRALESLVHSCSSVLWGMVERFPSFRNKRDAFDRIAANTLGDLTVDVEGNGQTNTTPHSGSFSFSDLSDMHDQVRHSTLQENALGVSRSNE